MKRSMTFLVAAVLSGLGIAGPSQAELKLFEVGTFEVTDQVNKSEGTMSGSHQHRIRTDKLFAGFHLLNSNTEDKEVDLGSELKHAPIWLPAGVVPKDLRLCAEIKSVNGYYLANGRGSLLDAAVSANLGMQPIPYNSENLHEVRNEFPEKYLLPRVMVATDCDERRSKYYVPVGWDAVPDKLLAVVEIGAATVQASLHPIGLDNALVPTAKPTDLECQPTKRVQVGYDCTIELSELAKYDSDAYEFRLKIDRPGIEPAVRKAQLTLPRK